MKTEAIFKDKEFPVPLPASFPKGWHREKNALMESLGAQPDQCPSFRNSNGLFVTLTCQREQDGNRWIHLSVSRRDRIPNYFDLCDVKAVFLGKDSLAYLIFAPQKEHVNIHEYCLHLWTCLDGRPTPDFTWGMGSI